MHAMMGVHGGNTAPRALGEVTSGAARPSYLVAMSKKNVLFTVYTRSGWLFFLQQKETRIVETPTARLRLREEDRERARDRGRGEGKWELRADGSAICDRCEAPREGAGDLLLAPSGHSACLVGVEPHSAHFHVPRAAPALDQVCNQQVTMLL